MHETEKPSQAVEHGAGLRICLFASLASLGLVAVFPLAIYLLVASAPYPGVDTGLAAFVLAKRIIVPLFVLTEAAAIVGGVVALFARAPWAVMYLLFHGVFVAGLVLFILLDFGFI